MVAIILVVLFNLVVVFQTQAVCPVCAIAVGAGLGLSEKLGIDDVVSGLWIGGIIVSMIMWTMEWMEKKRYHFKGDAVAITLGYYLMVLGPLYGQGIIGHPLNTLWNIDKLVLGVGMGSIAFFLGGAWYYRIKAKNNGKAQFPFQKVVMPIAPLLVLSIIFYFITR